MRARAGSGPGQEVGPATLPEGRDLRGASAAIPAPVDNPVFSLTLGAAFINLPRLDETTKESLP